MVFLLLPGLWHWYFADGMNDTMAVRVKRVLGNDERHDETRAGAREKHGYRGLLFVLQSP